MYNICRFAVKDPENLSNQNAYSLDFFHSVVLQDIASVCYPLFLSLSLSLSLYFIYSWEKKDTQTKHVTHAHHKTTPDDQLLENTSWRSLRNNGNSSIWDWKQSGKWQGDIKTKIEWWWRLVRVGGRMGVGGYWCIWTCGRLRCRGALKEGGQVSDW